MTPADFRLLAGRLYDRLPRPLLTGLNGGLSVLDRVKTDREGPPGTFILGEYHIQEPGLGRLICIYHGSFLRVLGNAPPAAWEEELWRTMLHEIRHHREAMAGRNDLADEEAGRQKRTKDEVLSTKEE